MTITIHDKTVLILTKLKLYMWCEAHHSGEHVHTTKIVACIARSFVSEGSKVLVVEEQYKGQLIHKRYGEGE